MKPSNQKHRRVFGILQNQQKKREFTRTNVGSISLFRVGIYALVCLISGTVVGLGLFGARTASATAGINAEMSFQGKIVTSTGQNIADGTYNMEFKIYSGCTNEPTNNTGCTLVWTEDSLVSHSDGVAFTSGTYQTNLGQYCPFAGGACTPSGVNDGNTNSGVNWNSYPLYLSLQIGNTSSCSPSSNNFQATCGGDGEMNPYVLLTSTPYAMNSNAVGGFTASQLGQLAANQTWTNTNTFQNASSKALLTVDTSGNKVSLGQAGSSGIAGVLVLNSTNAGNFESSFTVSSLQAANIDYVLPSSITTSQCLQTGATTATNLVWGTCGSGGGGANTALSNLASVAINTDLQFANTGSRTINIAATGAGVAGQNLTIQAGNSGTGAVNGGNLVLQAGATGGSGTTGSVIVKANGTNSTTAFQVQSSTASPVLTADTSNQQITVGQNNTSTAAPGLIVSQASTGDATIALQPASSANSFYVGVDASNSDAFTINSYAAATQTGSPYTLGQTTHNTSDSNTSLISVSSFTTTTAGTISSISVKFEEEDGGSSDHFGVAIYADDGSGNNAGAFIAAGTTTPSVSAPTPGAENVNTINIPTTSLNPSTKYWLAVITTTSNSIMWAQNPSSNRTCWNTGTVGTWPGTFPTTPDNGCQSGFTYDIYTTVTPGSSLTDTNSNALFTLSQSGAAQLRNYSNSTAAFQVQNANGYNVLGADTTNGWAVLGTSSHVNGGIVLDNATNANTVSILTGVTAASGGTGYTITLPTTGSTSGSCLQSGSGSTTAATNLTWGACGGGGGGTQTVTLVPEFPGAVFHASGSSNQGYMQSDYDSTGNHNYYEWSTDQATAQTYDIVVRYQVPSGYTSSGAWTVYDDVDSASGTAITVDMKNTHSGTTTDCNSGFVTLTVATSWQSRSIANASCTFAANDVITLDFRLQSTGTGTVWTKLGELSFQYN